MGLMRLGTMWMIPLVVTLLAAGFPSMAAATEPVKSLSAPPELTSESEEGFHDLVLFIESHERLSGGAQSIRASAVHRGKRVGLEILLGAVWRSVSLGEDVLIAAFQGEMRYRSIGAESDALVRVVDEAYGTKTGAKGMAKETLFTGITLQGDPRDLGKGPVQVKLFYGAEAAIEGEYAELYTNIDFGKRRLEIREKHPDYRLPLVKALRAEHGRDTRP